MANVGVQDYQIWINHIDGDPKLVERLEALAAGQTIRLRVAGIVGDWRKMENSRRTGKPTQGLKPLGAAFEHWTRLNQTHRDATVELVEERPSDWRYALEPERSVAWAAFKALTAAGWRSESAATDRSDLHKR